MINLAFSESIFAFILIIIAYFISITINEVAQAWVAKKVGDDTAYEAGYASWNPLDHVNFLKFGFLAILFFGIGFLESVPFDMYLLAARHRLLRTFIFFSTEVLVSLFVGLTSLTISIAAFGQHMTIDLLFKIFKYYRHFFYEVISFNSHLNIASIFKEDTSSVTIILAFLLVTLVYLNIFIAFFSLVNNFVKFILALGFEKGYSYAEYARYIELFAPLIIILLFGGTLSMFLFKATILIASKIAALLGVL